MFVKFFFCFYCVFVKGDLEYVKLLVEEGYDVNVLDEFGWFVLYVVVIIGNFDCCVWLIDVGVDFVEYINFVIDEYRMLCC